MEIVVGRDELGREIKLNPARDVAFFWPTIVAVVIENLCNPKAYEPHIQELMRANHITPRSLVELAVKYAAFMGRCTDPTVQDIYKGLASVGYFQHHPVETVILQYFLGLAATGAFFHGIKSKSRANEQPLEMDTLAQKVSEFVGHLRSSPSFPDIDIPAAVQPPARQVSAHADPGPTAGS